jgi:hypothetical protein
MAERDEKDQQFNETTFFFFRAVVRSCLRRVNQPLFMQTLVLGHGPHATHATCSPVGCRSPRRMAGRSRPCPAAPQ